MTAVSFHVLGPLEADGPGGPIVLRGARQRAVLARLLIARGRVVPLGMLIDDLWSEPPKGAVGAIRTFVADLRRALEPGRAARQPATVLVTAPPGYLLRAEPQSVDAGRFEALVAEAGALMAAGVAVTAGASVTAEVAARALAGLEVALGLWRGPAYGEWTGVGWARGEIDRLDELRMLAVERRAAALLALGRAAEAACDLRGFAAGQPLREGAWQLLATALYRAGRQGEALAALRQARETAVAELGVDPGPGLRQLEADILAQAPHLDPPARRGLPETRPSLPEAHRGPSHGPSPVPHSASPGQWSKATDRLSLGGDTEADAGKQARPDTGDQARPRAEDQARTGAEDQARTGAGERAADRAERSTSNAVSLAGDRAGGGRAVGGSLSGGGPGGTFFGRAAELTLLEAAAEGISRPRLVLVCGDAGAGKTALAEAFTRRLTGLGWTSLWARSPEHDGAKVDWPWGSGEEPVALEPAVARVRRRDAAIRELVALAGDAPVLLVVDDLHWADEEALELLAALPGASGRILVVGTYRATDITPELTAALGRFARHEPVRVYLGGLAAAATGELARAVAGRELDRATTALIQRRTGGNPFFVRELARLVAAEGGAGLERIPAGVRDVLRHRLATLPEPGRVVLRQAAVLGRDVDPEVLAELAGPGTVDAVDEALRAGFLIEDGPAGLRFTHILVRDTLYDDLSGLRRAGWHAAAGAVLERLRPADVTTLAHHFARAASRATAGRAARYSAAAAEIAERQVNPREAARLWEQAVAAYDRDDTAGVRARLAAVMGLGRALAVTGRLESSRRCRDEAMTVAEELDDPALLPAVLTAFDVPAVWARNDDERLSGRIVRAAERALVTVPDEQPELRARLLATIALESRGSTGDQGLRAAVEAERIARAVGDPALLAYALDARFMQSFHRPGLAAERARIGAELVDLAAEHELVTFEVLGRLICLQSDCALGDFAAADAQAAAVDRLADRYDLPVVGVFTQLYAALRLAATGPAEEHTAGGAAAEETVTGRAVAGRAIAGRADAGAAVETAYRAAFARLERSGMPGMSDGLLGLALLSIGRSGECADPWARPLLLLGSGRRDEAATALRELAEPPHDQLLEARLGLMLQAADALGTPDAELLRDRLAPASGELAGAASGIITFGPVAAFLAGRAAGLPHAISR